MNMNRIGQLSVAVCAIALSVAALPIQAAQPGSQIITVATPVGSGHRYDGVLDVCNGKFSATGTTVGYQEVVEGTVTDATLNYTSIYVGDVNDGLGIWNPYSYEVDAIRSGGVWSGIYTVTKTNTPPLRNSNRNRIDLRNCELWRRAGGSKFQEPWTVHQVVRHCAVGSCRVDPLAKLRLT